MRPRLEGLTDEELHWEPVPGCWGVRPREQATTEMAAGVGDWVIDFAFPEPDPPPFTTIAWRLWHVIEGVFGGRASAHFGDGRGIDYEGREYLPDAAGTLAALGRGLRGRGSTESARWGPTTWPACAGPARATSPTAPSPSWSSTSTARPSTTWRRC